MNSYQSTPMGSMPQYGGFQNRGGMMGGMRGGSMGIRGGRGGMNSGGMMGMPMGGMGIGTMPVQISQMPMNMPQMGTGMGMQGMSSHTFPASSLHDFGPSLVPSASHTLYHNPQESKSPNPPTVHVPDGLPRQGAYGPR